MEPEDSYFEDASIEDIGLTWVLSKRTVPDSLSVEDAELYPYDGPAEMWLRFTETAVDTFDRTKARQLGQDIDRLVTSPLSDETLRTVWLGAVLCQFDPAEHGLDMRAWLNRMRKTWLARVHRGAPDFVAAPPQPVMDEELWRAVLQAIAPVADDLDRALTNSRRYGASVVGFVPALEAVVSQACADLGYRLFLRVMKEYFLRVEAPAYDTFIALGKRFEYPPYLVGDNLNYQG
ncbi:hypothetical protein [Streptomyces acidiscabies]|uniref:hypothetical protein n=1 Tax=Streptomyces acidiscabies TaxID=42234 RepID=UPI00067BFA35|nr:hypothetical protein [Streptomyces acidiscabies]